MLRVKLTTEREARNKLQGERMNKKEEKDRIRDEARNFIIFKIF